MGINTARTVFAGDEDERRLLCAGWTPKDRCGPLGLTIWANLETGFYSSQENALHRLDNPLPRSPYRKLPDYRDPYTEATCSEGRTS